MILQYQFVQNALIAGTLASIVCGLIGVIIVEKKLVMMSGGIAHTSYGGVGLGYLLGFEPILGALLVSILAALGIGFIKRRGGTRSDLVIGIFWSLGMAMGILFVSLMEGYPPDLSSYLFGSILSVTRSDIYLMTVLTVFVVTTVTLLFNHWKAYMFDEEFSSILGIKTAFLEYLLFILIAMAVVVLIRVVGIILILALFTAPPAVAELISKSLKGRMVLSVAIGTSFTMSGLFLSYALDIPSGATIVFVSAIVYLLAYMIKHIKEEQRYGKL